MRSFSTSFLIVIVSKTILVISLKNDPSEDSLVQETQFQHHNIRDGASYHDLHHSNENYHEKRGHQSRKKHSKGDHGRQGKSFHKNDYGEEHLKKDDHHDEADNYQHNNEESKTLKTAKFGEEEGHKRGHKTRGYHNKFFKDEYHREHKFYDNYRRKGHFKKHDDYSNKYASKEGGRKRKGNRNSSYGRNEYGKKGQYDRGRYEDENRGKNLKKGNEKFYRTNEDYGISRNTGEGGQYRYGNG